MTDPEPRYLTMVEALLALADTTECGARFLQRSGDPVFYPYRTVLSRARAVAGELQARGVRPGDRVGIVLPTSIHFLDLFLGTQLAGAIPAALYPPVRLGRLDEYYRRTRDMLTGIGARFLVTDLRMRKLLGPVVSGVDSLENVWMTGDLHGQSPWTPVPIEPRDPAFLQFSSGTTQTPKAVVITHANLVANLEMMFALFRSFSQADFHREAVCWLPLYHDMGLVGCLFNGLYYPGTVTYIEPERFLAKPALWLQTISRFGAGASPAPQFAYSLCVNKIKDEELEGVDLSSWTIALNGAEPNDITGMDRFIARFSKWGFRETAMTPVYGLAEATLAVTFSDIRTPPALVSFDRLRLDEEGRAAPGEGLRLASVGQPFPGWALEIRDQDDTSLPEGRLGNIWISGAALSPGYFNDPVRSEKALRRGWLDTGDLGFIYGGNLFVYGRSKELVIIRGRNIAPQDVERSLDGLAGVRPGAVVAVGTVIPGEGEQLVVLVENDRRHPRPEKALIEAIRQRVLESVSVRPYHIQLLEPGTLPRTSSGKKRRIKALELYRAGELVPPEKMGPLRLLVKLGQSRVAWHRYRQNRRRKNR